MTSRSTRAVSGQFEVRRRLQAVEPGGAIEMIQCHLRRHMFGILLKKDKTQDAATARIAARRGPAVGSRWHSRVTCQVDNAFVTSSAADEVRRVGIRIAALAQDGLRYGADEYDRDRYRQLRQLAAELFSALTGRPAEDLALELGRDSGYATPKIDVRGVVFDEQERVLLMREKVDSRWSVPGGWADPGESPSAAATREILEEAGYPTSAVKLVACWDRELQGNPPPLPVHVYKLFFLCRVNGIARPPSALETLDVGWFDINAPPPLSLGRVNHHQLERALAHHRDPSLPTEFD